MHPPSAAAKGCRSPLPEWQSLVQRLNYQVKGTEMFWHELHAAAAILQVRAMVLCDIDASQPTSTPAPWLCLHQTPQARQPWLEQTKLDVHPFVIRVAPLGLRPGRSVPLFGEPRHPRQPPDHDNPRSTIPT